jgi:competence protein ComEC
MAIGIVTQWYFPISIDWLLILLSVCLLNFFCFYSLSIPLRFKFRYVQSVLLLSIILIIGMMLTWNKNLHHHSNWYGHFYKKEQAILVRIDEPLIEKEKTYKTILSVKKMVLNDSCITKYGNILVYFKKEKNASNLKYGDVIWIKKPLQNITNSGNPGSFNNQQYQSFQQIYHQVYLTEKDYIITNKNEANKLRKTVYKLRDFTLRVLKQNLSNKNGILGIAEALLIGYKNDLDSNLTQTYSKAGVVHIIAISGLHLGLIYGMLLWLLNRIPLIDKNELAKALVLLCCLWMFSLMTGASASVLRSAVMFTCIVFGNVLNRKASIYNSLAASAFLLLCYNPYLVWDVGFQLSYLAIIGIVWLQKPIQHLVNPTNLIVEKIWEMASITIAAQIITFPICIYYFHQFPNLFLLSNLIAVPLSTIILFAEIFLVVFFKISFIAKMISTFIFYAIQFLNETIVQINNIPFSIWNNIYANAWSTIFLYGFVVFGIYWILQNQKPFLRLSLLCSLLFCGNYAFAEIQTQQQHRLLIYNNAHSLKMDVICKKQYKCIGDNKVENDEKTLTYLLTPSRISFRANQTQEENKSFSIYKHIYGKHNKRLMVLDSAVCFKPIGDKIDVDVLVISKNIRVSINELVCSIKPKLIVFDASNSLWKISKWKKECEALNLRFFSIKEQGAFVMNLQ